MKPVLFLFLLVSFALGCNSVYQGTKEATKPVGKTMGTLGGVSDGALEGYRSTDPDNPYNR